jgi:hypothetical protein
MNASSAKSLPPRAIRRRAALQRILALGFGCAATLPASDGTEPAPPVIEIVNVETTKRGISFYDFDFFFLADGGEEVTGIEFRGAVNRRPLDSWKSWPYLGSDDPFPITLACWAFDFEVRAVDSAGRRSAPAKWSFTEPAVKPVIRSPLSAKGKVGRNFQYQIRASHALRYNAVGLPPGLAVNAATGKIAGKPLKAGKYRLTLVASNKRVTTRKTAVFEISR